jgi:hypothetical protein
LGNDESHENKLDEGSDNTNTFDYTLASSKNEIFDSSSSAKKILVVDSIQTMCVIDRIFNDKIRKIPYDWYYIEFRNIEGDIEKSFAIDENAVSKKILHNELLINNSFSNEMLIEVGAEFKMFNQNNLAKISEEKYQMNII